MVTNYHVIEGASEVKVALSDKREFDAEIALKDEHSDLTVLRLKGVNERFPVLDFADSDALAVGDLVLAIGDPFGVGQTVTHGIVSALARTQVGISDYQFFIQTDAAINPGNSGGALVDLSGQLVGINTAIYSRSGGSQGIGFAHPARHGARGGHVGQGRQRRGQASLAGAKLQEVTPEIGEGLGLKRPSGALVANLLPAGPAAHAGMKTGDVIVSIDGTIVDDPNSFDYRFATKPLGGTAQVALLRQGHDVSVTISLQSAPDTPREEVEIKARSPFLGATVANLSPALADELRLDAQAEGVVIIGVADGSGRPIGRLPQGRHCRFRQQSENRKIRRSRPPTRAGSRQWRVIINRGGQQISAMFAG